MEQHYNITNVQFNEMYFNNSIIATIDSSILNILNSNKKAETINVLIDNIELDFNDKIKELKENCYIENITSIYNGHKSLEIIQKELEVIKLISKYSLQNNVLEYNFIISCLKYLYKLSEILRIRLNQPIININKMNKNNIIRCSYKFCNFKDSCVYNYNKKGNCCYQDHYVHNMISHDLLALILYIESINTSDCNSSLSKIEDSGNMIDTIFHNKEILKSINTLSFVIGHMETELRTKCMYADKKEWDSFHYIHNIKK